MVICALARNHDKHDRRNGPLRRMYDDQHEILRRLERLEVNNAGWRNGGYNPSAPYGPGISPIVPQPYVPPYTNTPVPGTGTGGWPGLGPNQIWCGTSTTATSLTIPDTGASAAGYGAVPPRSLTATSIVERVDDLLKNKNYRGSSVGVQQDDV